MTPGVITGLHLYLFWPSHQPGSAQITKWGRWKECPALSPPAPKPNLGWERSWEGLPHLKLFDDTKDTKRISSGFECSSTSFLFLMRNLKWILELIIVSWWKGWSSSLKADSGWPELPDSSGKGFTSAPPRSDANQKGEQVGLGPIYICLLEKRETSAK